MTQTAERLKDEQYLKLATAEVGDVEKENINADVKFVIDTPLFKKSAPFYYRNRLRVSLTISEEFRNSYIMVRGLIEFHRPKDFSFTYQLMKRTIEADIEVVHLETLKVFLGKVLLWTKQEKQFKHALKLALEFETRYKLERDSVYAVMNNTVAAAQASNW
jgi:hypothetical protein